MFSIFVLPSLISLNFLKYQRSCLYSHFLRNLRALFCKFSTFCDDFWFYKFHTTGQLLKLKWIKLSIKIFLSLNPRKLFNLNSAFNWQLADDFQNLICCLIVYNWILCSDIYIIDINGQILWYGVFSFRY